jgi:hypothetical protein
VPKLPDVVYNWVKYLVLIALPAAATAYAGLDLPNEDSVVKYLAVAATFLGTLVGLSAVSYNRNDSNFNGVLEVNKNDPSVLHSLDLDNTDPEDLARAKTVRLKVKRVDAEIPPPEGVA